MRAKRKKQVKRSEAEWKAILEKFAKSDLTIEGFCRREDLVHSTFKRWQQKLGGQSPGRFVDLSPRSEPVVAACELSIQLPNGVQLQFRG